MIHLVYFCSIVWQNVLFLSLYVAADRRNLSVQNGPSLNPAAPKSDIAVVPDRSLQGGLLNVEPSSNIQQEGSECRPMEVVVGPSCYCLEAKLMQHDSDDPRSMVCPSQTSCKFYNTPR